VIHLPGKDTTNTIEGIGTNTSMFRYRSDIFCIFMKFLNQYKMKLLIAVDLSDATDKILERIKDFASKINPKIWIVHVVQPDPDFVGYEVGPKTERDFIAKKFHEKHTKLQTVAKELKEKGLDTTPLLLQGATVETILEEADDINADMIIVGSHGRGMMYNIFIGSVSKELLKHSKRPVLIIPTRE
jgi:nucleotide-binding universal stress UspA family protein